MQRLVLIYTISVPYEYSETITEPIIYESQEKAYEDFKNKVIEVKNMHDGYQKSTEIWQRRLDSISHKNLDKRNKCFGERPKVPSSEFSFGGQTFFFYNFINKESKLSEYEAPQILTLDEWYK